MNLRMQRQILVQNRDQFVVVLTALRERLRAGVWVQGEPLTVIELAGAWGVSATPVREALARLAGEGLVEDRRGRGYFAWRIDVSDLADLYQAQEALLSNALASLVRGLPNPPRLASHRDFGSATATSLQGEWIDGPLFWEAFSWRVIREAGHRFLLGAQQRLADRLAPCRRLEPLVLTETPDDLNRLAEAVNRRAWSALINDIPPFFARRRAAAGVIVDRLRLEAQAPFQDLQC
jgi:DNA-binding transcriptional regulator YhcF (GntR family)